MYVCMNVSVYVCIFCIFTCACVYIYCRLCMRLTCIMYAYMYEFMYVLMYVYECMCMRIYMHNMYMRVHSYMYNLHLCATAHQRVSVDSEPNNRHEMG